ncbi:hypothetical protein E2C01_031411 [Portunus trituberculatus]|uniref:Secreted protein n=1 Tax=Portunus trituberculatus TaxID=210409 RepID=A0A5B7EXJ2_PORTR|nr:hypothetical protein [Portunus trituberculatus]
MVVPVVVVVVAAAGRVLVSPQHVSHWGSGGVLLRPSLPKPAKNAYLKLERHVGLGGMQFVCVVVGGAAARQSKVEGG